MADFIQPSEIKTVEEAKVAAEKIVGSEKNKIERRRFELEKALKQIAEISPADGGFEEVAVLLTLPDESFSMIAPIFLQELEKNYKNINDQLTMV